MSVALVNVLISFMIVIHDGDDDYDHDDYDYYYYYSRDWENA